jgi:hypothetical protein
MAEKTIDEMSDGERYDRFLAAWEKHQKSGFEITQEAADRIAAMWKVQAPKLQEWAAPTVISNPRRGW